MPYVDLAAAHRPLRQQLLDAVASVIDSGQFVLGPQVSAFEEAMATLCGTKFAVAVNSGTDALTLSLLALGIHAGDEVITAPNSFVASASCIALCGATPVFADVGNDYLIDPAQIEKSITLRTRAIVPVHLTGAACHMTAINAIARKHKLVVVEDAAQAILAEHREQRVGSMSNAGCFSLHPLKTLNACGDGGVITTNDAALVEQLKKRRNLGLRSREQCDTWSSNSRLDTMQAAMLLVKLNHLQRWTQQRIDNAAYYQAKLAGVCQLQCPTTNTGDRSVYHTFVIQAQQRDALQQHLSSCGVQAAVHYPIPIHLQDVAVDLGYAPGSFPVAEAQSKKILSLPIYPELTLEQRDHVVASIIAFYQK